MAEEFEQLSCLMDDAQMAMTMVKAMISAQSPFVPSKLLLEIQGEILQLTFDYVERCAFVVDAAMQRMTKAQLLMNWPQGGK